MRRWISRHGSAGSALGGGVNHVGHGLGLRQIEFSVQVGASGELARLGVPRAELNAATHQCLQHDG